MYDQQTSLSWVSDGAVTMTLEFLWYMRYQRTRAATEKDLPTEFPAMQRVVSEVRKLSASSACLLQKAGRLRTTLLNLEMELRQGSYSFISQGGVGFEIMKSAETFKTHPLLPSDTGLHPDMRFWHLLETRRFPLLTLTRLHHPI